MHDQLLELVSPVSKNLVGRDFRDHGLGDCLLGLRFNGFRLFWHNFGLYFRDKEDIKLLLLKKAELLLDEHAEDLGDLPFREGVGNLGEDELDELGLAVAGQQEHIAEVLEAGVLLAGVELNLLDYFERVH